MGRRCAWDNLTPAQKESFGNATNTAAVELGSTLIPPVRAARAGRAVAKAVSFTNKVSPKNVQKFESKRAAFRAAKRDAGIPTSQTHKTHTKNLKADQLDTSRTATEYDFGGGQKVQDHPSGHKFSDGGVYDKSHLNNHGTGGTKGHYEY